MANPVVVFVVPNRFCFKDIFKGICDSKCISSEDIDAVGVTDAGRMDVPAEKCGEYALLLLDDSRNWSGKKKTEDAPCRMTEGDRLLRIIEHNSSEENSGPWSRLFGVARPVPCKGFSHYDGDHVFDAIYDILTADEDETRAGVVNQFIGECNDADILQAMDGLAAVCQIRIIDHRGKTDLEYLEEWFLSRCPELRGDYDYAGHKKETEPGKSEKRLGKIRKAGQDLLRKSGGRESGSSCDGA